MTTKPLRVLLVLRTGRDGTEPIRALRVAGYISTIEFVRTREDLCRALDRGDWDLILAASGRAGLEWDDVVAEMNARTSDIPLVLIARPEEEPAAIYQMYRGAYDYVLEGRFGRLAASLGHALRFREDARMRKEAELGLRQSYDRFVDLIDNANDVVFTTDLAGNFTSLNKAGEEISGYTREEVCMMNMAQVLTPESLILAQEMTRQKLVDNRPTVYQLEMIARDGHRVALEASTRLIRHDGQPVAIQGIARDITERKRAAQALRDSEERYRGLFENSSDIVYTHDLQGKFTSVNQAAEGVTGYSRSEILQLSIDKLIVPEHLAHAREMIRHKLFEQRPTTYELDVRAKDGRRRSLEINSQLIYSGGTPVGVQGIARDVTERRRDEEKLRARERQQAAVAELGQSALASTDAQQLFRDAVACIISTLGVDYSALLEYVAPGNVLESRAGSGWRPGLQSATVPGGRASPSGYALIAEGPLIVENIHQDGRFAVPQVLLDHQVTSSISVKVHGVEEPFGVLSAYTRQRREFTQDDVNFLQSVANVLATAIQRRRLEEESSRHNKELATRVLQAQEEERKRIARELHDETAQSLSMLLTHLDLLEPHIPSGPGNLRTGFERVGELARRTLDETRALSHDLRPTILDDAGLMPALHWLAAEYEETFGLSVRVDKGWRSGVLLSPEVEMTLFRIVQEALTNSGKHARASVATVSLSVGATEARLVVTDDGMGFDPNKVPKPTRAGRLGLYGMQERAALLGGKLTLTSHPGKGTRLEASVPLPGDPTLQEEK